MSVAGKLTIVFIIILQLILSMTICVMLVYYGPFTVVRKYVVGTAMSSKSHQYLATWFLSKAEIKSILAVKISDISQKTSIVTISTSHDKSIKESEVISPSGQFHGYLLDVTDPSRVMIGMTSKLGEQGETTSQIAIQNNAVAAINGGGFHDSTQSGGLWTGTGSLPTYFVILGGKVVYKDDNFNNKEKTSVIAFDKIGDLIIGNHSINDLLNLGVTQSIAFGPALVINGKPTFSGDGGQGITARTAIGQTANGHILLLVLDGRRINMPGASLYDEQQIMLKKGAVNAANLDGGSSTTMYYNGKIINDPCDPLGERTVATAIYVTQ
jgi:exopolysaccharide biosynthesis protein